ncbi:hypothetical protein MOB65_20420 [Bacillus inaquosorum]|uniref:hypothetical protein n=1 Tax=Bacillus inaquosorum TaxID=483913 RepID=UPI00228324FD|nr:hypothetical protein [Bacillus inaquosorum]MCY7911224.1 hypothetical protein [Bacillus inaquosorum]
MRKYKRRLYVFSFMFNGEKTYHDVKMLPKYSREEALEQFKKSNPNATDVKIESTSMVTVEM